MRVPEDQIKGLVEQARKSVNLMELFDECNLHHVDLDAMNAADELTFQEVAISYALAGYIIGIEYALRNIELREKDSD